jgi:DNA-damage-inducible protein J
MTTVATKKKSAYIRARVRPHIKKEAERVLERLGISMTDAIGVFLSQVSLQGGLPFDVKVPNEETQAALREDLSNARPYTDVEKMFNDILGKNWRKKK